MRIVKVEYGLRLPIGKKGENLVTQVQFPLVKQWKEAYGDGGTFQLIHKRPFDDYVYACVIDQDVNNIIWNITNTELAQAGVGSCELQYYVGQTLAKSVTWNTVIADSIYEGEVTPPDPWASWVEEVLRVNGDYEALNNKPKINSVELMGNKSLDDLDIQVKGDYADSALTNWEIENLIDSFV